MNTHASKFERVFIQSEILILGKYQMIIKTPEKTKE